MDRFVLLLGALTLSLPCAISASYFNVTRIVEGGDVFQPTELPPECNAALAKNPNLAANRSSANAAASIFCAQYGAARSVAAELCRCQCHADRPIFLQHIQHCADALKDCRSIAFTSDPSQPSAAKSAPTFFLPLNGQIINTQYLLDWKGANVIVHENGSVPCKIHNAGFLTDTGWRHIRENSIISLYTASHYTYLQWNGNKAAEEKLAGKLVVVGIKCQVVQQHSLHLQSDSQDNRSVITLPLCIPFRVAGNDEGFVAFSTSSSSFTTEPLAIADAKRTTKNRNDGDDDELQSDATIDRPSVTEPPTVAIATESPTAEPMRISLIIGIASAVLLILIVCIAITIWIFCWRKQKRKLIEKMQLRIIYQQQRQAMQQQQEFNNFIGAQNGHAPCVPNSYATHPMHEAFISSTLQGIQPDMPQPPANGERFIHSPRTAFQESWVQELGMPLNMAAVTYLGQVGGARHLYTASGHAVPCFTKDEIDFYDRINNNLAAAFLQHGSSPHAAQFHGGVNASNGSFAHGDGSNGGGQLIRRKLYFSPDFFEPELMADPPPMAEEFLVEVRRMIELAKNRIRSRRYIPSLLVIPENSDSLSEPPFDASLPSAGVNRSRRLFAKTNADLLRFERAKQTAAAFCSDGRRNHTDAGTPSAWAESRHSDVERRDCFWPSGENDHRSPADSPNSSTVSTNSRSLTSQAENTTSSAESIDSPPDSGIKSGGDEMTISTERTGHSNNPTFRPFRPHRTTEDCNGRQSFDSDYDNWPQKQLNGSISDKAGADRQLGANRPSVVLAEQKVSTWLQTISDDGADTDDACRINGNSCPNESSQVYAGSSGSDISTPSNCHQNHKANNDDNGNKTGASRPNQFRVCANISLSQTEQISPGTYNGTRDAERTLNQSSRQSQPISIASPACLDPEPPKDYLDQISSNRNGGPLYCKMMNDRSSSDKLNRSGPDSAISNNSYCQAPTVTNPVYGSLLKRYDVNLVGGFGYPFYHSPPGISQPLPQAAIVRSPSSATPQYRRVPNYSNSLPKCFDRGPLLPQFICNYYDASGADKKGDHRKMSKNAKRIRRQLNSTSMNRNAPSYVNSFPRVHPTQIASSGPHANASSVPFKRTQLSNSLFTAPPNHSSQVLISDAF